LEVGKGGAEDDEAQITLRKQIRGNRSLYSVEFLDHLFVVIYLLILATWTMGSDRRMFVRAAPKLGDVKLEHAVYFPLPGMVLCTYPFG
jgi:hypothetical protein